MIHANYRGTNWRTRDPIPLANALMALVGRDLIVVVHSRCGEVVRSQRTYPVLDVVVCVLKVSGGSLEEGQGVQINEVGDVCSLN